MHTNHIPMIPRAEMVKMWVSLQPKACGNMIRQAYICLYASLHANITTAFILQALPASLTCLVHRAEGQPVLCPNLQVCIVQVHAKELACTGHLGR